MKRSESNAALREMEAMVQRCGFQLPPFCSSTPEVWKTLGHEYDEIRGNMLGWDMTDHGLGRFGQVGFSLITLRNSNVKRLHSSFSTSYGPEYRGANPSGLAKTTEIH